MDLVVLLLFIAGLVLLVLGAELLVRGASRLATAVGISPLIVGLTIVAFGTSAPEMAVSVKSSLSGDADIALGNVVGSNIFNVLLILGVSAIITPLVVAQKLVRFDVPLLIGVSILTWLLALDGRIGRWEGALLFAGIIGYTALAVIQGRRESAAVAAEYAAEFAAAPARAPKAINIGLILVGLVMLVIGSDWLVDGAVAMARAFGVSELVIGLTIVAAGTSLPEVATSVMASIKGERDIAVGNVIGSNLFNLMAVLGLAALVSPDGVAVADSALRFDIPVMVAVAAACLPILFTGYLIARWEGWLFLLYYIAYTTLLILGATGSSAHLTLGNALLYFALPLTTLALAVGVVRHFRQRAPGVP